MKIGVQAVVFPGFVPVLEQAVQVQDRGFDSFFAGEHHHYPESTPVPEFYKESGVPGFYRFVPDPLLTLAAVSVAAPKLTLGTGILLLPIHDVLVLSNQISTLDHLAGGKTIFAFGIGWNKPELVNHGVEFETRIDKAFEQLQALRHLWTNKTSSFHGQFVRYEESSMPKPLQEPYPPLLMGGRLLRKNLQIIAEVADGWEPTDTYEKTFGGSLEADIEKLHGAVKAQGRDPGKLTNVFLYADLMLYDRNPAEFKKAAPNRDQLARLERLGFKQVLIGLPAFSSEHFYGALDHAAGVAEPWLFQS